MPSHSNCPPKPEREEPRSLGGTWSEGRYQVEVSLAALNHSSVLVVGRPARDELKVVIDDLHLNQQLDLIPLVVCVLCGLRLDLGLQVCDIELSAPNPDSLAVVLDVEARVPIFVAGVGRVQLLFRHPLRTVWAAMMQRLECE
jgi:hypothetical protein